MHKLKQFSEKTGIQTLDTHAMHCLKGGKKAKKVKDKKAKKVKPCDDKRD